MNLFLFSYSFTSYREKFRLLSLFLLYWIPVMSQAGVQVEKIQLSAKSGAENVSYLATAQFSYSLDKAVVEAIQNGVPIIFEENLEIEEYPKVWLLDKPPTSNLPSISRRFKISYHEFDQRFQITNEQNQHRYVADNLPFLLRKVGEHSLLLTIPFEALEKGKGYRILARTAIDAINLPGLMRPYVYTPYFWPEWKLDSGWQTHQFRP